MRSKIAWTVLVLAAVLIAIALTQFNLSAQQEPGLLKRPSATALNVSSFAAQATTESLPAQWT